MLTMTQMDMAGNIIRVMEDIENYPDHAPADVLPETTYDESVSWRFTEDGVLQVIDDATGEWAFTGSVSEDAWEYRRSPARGI